VAEDAAVTCIDRGFFFARCGRLDEGLDVLLTTEHNLYLYFYTTIKQANINFLMSTPQMYPV
jgi:hypothetical protein